MKKNFIKSLGFKSGGEEAALFTNREYVSLYQSTLAKTDVIANVCQLAQEERLKTDANFYQLHCLSLRTFVDWLGSHPLITLASIAANIYFVYEHVLK